MFPEIDEQEKSFMAFLSSPENHNKTFTYAELQKKYCYLSVFAMNNLLDKVNKKHPTNITFIEDRGHPFRTGDKHR